ncbi:MAG: hypothetical protein CMJ49_09305 [Planctomycetaceae bacterium]|nr:hypothetical protein [Planctomycetaceae bacterium]
MSTDQPKYYEAYEDRYRRVYAQGVEYWTGDPDEIAAVIGHVDEFLEFTGATPVGHSIIEFGCGEGFLGEYLLRRGYSYLGIDLAPSAVAKARNRIPGNDASFMLADITDAPDVRSGSAREDTPAQRSPRTAIKQWRSPRCRKSARRPPPC